MDKKSILDMAMGAFKERADYEMTKIIDNILDPNTDAVKKRTLAIVVEFTPDSERQNLRINTTVKSKLQPTNPIGSGCISLATATESLLLWKWFPRSRDR